MIADTIAAQPYALAIAGVVCFALGGIVGMLVGAGAKGASDADDYLECRHDGYQAGFRAGYDEAAGVDQEHESFKELP